jgi:hypothetical protein
LVPLSDASKSFFFFPMVMRRRAVVRDRSGGVRGVGDGNDDADRFFKAGRTGYDAIDDGAEAQPPSASSHAEEAAATLMVKAATKTPKQFTVEAMRLIQPCGSLPGEPSGKASGHLERLRRIRHDAS